MIKNVLEINNLSKKYEKFELKNINLKIPEGSILGLIGQNGAGKSTIIKSIMNIIPYDSGSIKINGNNVDIKNEILIKEEIGYVGEHLDFYPDVKLRQIYKFTCKFYRNWDESLFNRLIEIFNLDIDKKVKELSKGMVVKFSLAMALSHRPKFLLLDEPTSGLDPVIRSELLDILSEEVKSRKCSILFSSHITEDIIKIADTVAFIDNGEIKLVENKEKILKNYLYSKKYCADLNKFKNNMILMSDKFTILDGTGINNSELTLLKDEYGFNNISLDDVLLMIRG